MNTVRHHVDGKSRGLRVAAVTVGHTLRERGPMKFPMLYVESLLSPRATALALRDLLARKDVALDVESRKYRWVEHETTVRTRRVNATGSVAGAAMMPLRRIRYALTNIQHGGWSYDDAENQWCVSHGLANREHTAGPAAQRFGLTDLGERLLANVDAYLSQVLDALHNTGQLKGQEFDGKKSSKKTGNRNTKARKGTQVQPTKEVAGA